MGTVIHLNPHWSSLPHDVVKWFNYDVPFPAGVECRYSIIHTRCNVLTSHRPFQSGKGPNTHYDEVDQQATAEPESALGCTRTRAEDLKVTPKLCFRRETVLLRRNQCILVPILGRKHPFSVLESHFFGDDPV